MTEQVPLVSIDQGLAQIGLERVWLRAAERTRRAGQVNFIIAALYLTGYVKFAHLMPPAAARAWELLVWVSSAALLVPSFLWLCHALEKEWQAYARVAALTGHPGTSAGSTPRARLHLLVEFCRAGRG